MQVLTDKQYELLIDIMNNTKVFDKRDNTFLLSNRKIAKKIGVSDSTINRLMRVLSKHNLIKKVINSSYTKEGKKNTNKVIMLSPKFLFISYTKSDRWWCGALFELEDINKVYQWSDNCRALNCFIDPTTGEQKPFNWWLIDCKANQYTCFDRCYRKKSKEIYYSDDENNTQYYSLKDSDIDGLTLYDSQWLSSINKQSDFNYKGVNYV